jgi:hypothetical protein
MRFFTQPFTSAIKSAITVRMKAKLPSMYCWFLSPFEGMKSYNKTIFKQVSNKQPFNGKGLKNKSLFICSLTASD